VHEPWEVATQQGKAYKVFTPFSRSFGKLDHPDPFTAPEGPVHHPDEWPDSLTLPELELLPEIPWDGGLHENWDPSRSGALAKLDRLEGERLSCYGEARDFPSVSGTSRLSPYLHWGQVGPREVLAWIARQPVSEGAKDFGREVVWREFAYHVLYHFPNTPEHPLQPKYEDFPWKPNAGCLRAWQKGNTGYPMVDAGMRELWHTGWMHNRVRMIVASFLVKHLLQSWYEGARWFWDTLVDADLASNTLGWQWAGGCGADAAPYFRIFNPMTQGKKFDPEGDYVRRWIPELRDLPKQYLHEPWEAPANVLERAGVALGKDYPEPIINHKEGRERALAALNQIKEN